MLKIKILCIELFKVTFILYWLIYARQVKNSKPSYPYHYTRKTYEIWSVKSCICKETITCFGKTWKLLNINMFPCLFSVYNAISFSRNEQELVIWRAKNIILDADILYDFKAKWVASNRGSNHIQWYKPIYTLVYLQNFL